MEQNENNIKTESKTKHSDAIQSIGILLIVMGIIAGVILGCLYKVATYNGSYSIPDYNI